MRQTVCLARKFSLVRSGSLSVYIMLWLLAIQTTITDHTYGQNLNFVTRKIIIIIVFLNPKTVSSPSQNTDFIRRQVTSRHPLCPTSQHQCSIVSTVLFQLAQIQT